MIETPGTTMRARRIGHWLVYRKRGEVFGEFTGKARPAVSSRRILLRTRSFSGPLRPANRVGKAARARTGDNDELGFSKAARNRAVVWCLSAGRPAVCFHGSRVGVRRWSGGREHRIQLQLVTGGAGRTDC